MALEIDGSLSVPEAELEWRFSTSSGPGGQHANRANTRVELRWDVGRSSVPSASQRSRLIERLGPVVAVVVDDERSQARNRELARTRLAGRISAALVVKKRRRATRPSRRAKERRLAGKRRTGENKRLRRRPSNED